jgi:hypothetical protein
VREAGTSPRLSPEALPSPLRANDGWGGLEEWHVC